MDEFLSKILGIEKIRLDEGKVDLDWHSLPPAWMLLLIFVGITIVVHFLYRKERQDAGGGVKTFLGVLRTILLIWILLLLFGPMLTVDTIKEKKAIVAVLIDDSESMAKKDPKPPEGVLKGLSEACGVSTEQVLQLCRAELVKKTLTNEKLKLLEQLEKNNLQVRLYPFSKTVRSIKKDEIGSLDYKGNETAIGDAIRHVMSLHQTEKIAAFVLISDGKNNSGTDPRELAAQLQKLLIRIVCVAPGYPQDPMDIGLSEPSAVDMVLLNEPMTIEYIVEHKGFDGQEAKVEMFSYPMRSEDEDLRTTPEAIEERIRAARREETKSYTLEGGKSVKGRSVWIPKEKGMFELILKIEPREDEITKKNNYITQKVRVADKLVKVLYVDHLPRWEYRYLKNALIRDNTILCHCLLTSADKDFPQEHSQAAGRAPEQVRENADFFEPLTEFPRDLKGLLKYDIIILGDVHPDLLGSEETQENLVKFAGDFGGGVIFIAGTRNNPDAYSGTELEKLLPVVPSGGRGFEGPGFDKALGYSLTEAGKQHQITRFQLDDEQNKRTWEDMDAGLPGIYWYKPVKQLKPNAFSLVDLRDVTQKGARAPLFVWSHYGRGRIFMSLTDETWHWRFLRGDNPYFFPFWKQALHWARQARLHSEKRFHVKVEKEKYALRETVKFYAFAYDQDFNPITDETLEATLIPPVGNQIKIVFKRDTSESEKNKTFRGEYVPRGEGHYIIKCGEMLDEKDQAQDHFDVVIENREEIDPIIDSDRLKSLAQISQGGAEGNFLTLDEVKTLPDRIAANIIQFTETKEDDIWDSPLAYLLFALIITIEWVIRKIYRML
jgi:hypothetical protein